MDEPVVIRPDFVRILGRDYDFNYMEALPGDVLGLWHINDMRIDIKEGQHPTEEADTMLHEVIHGISDLHRLNLSESRVARFATGLIAVFQDNPEFCKYIMQQKGIK